MAAYIVQGYDNEGLPYDESIYPVQAFDAVEYGSDAAAEAATVAEFERLADLDPDVEWEVVRAGVPASA
ncbi:hypothetical protein [Streptomyces sp. YIM S03343]